MQGLPAGGQIETVALYGVVLVVFGCLKSWVSPDMNITKAPWQCCDIHCKPASMSCMLRIPAIYWRPLL